MKQLVLALFSLPTTEAASDPYDRNGKRYRIIQSWPRIRVLRIDDLAVSENPLLRDRPVACKQLDGRSIRCSTSCNVDAPGS
jgi:hypothetical protein